MGGPESWAGGPAAGPGDSTGPRDPSDQSEKAYPTGNRFSGLPRSLGLFENHGMLELGGSLKKEIEAC